VERLAATAETVTVPALVAEIRKTTGCSRATAYRAVSGAFAVAVVLDWDGLERDRAQKRRILTSTPNGNRTTPSCSCRRALHESSQVSNCTSASCSARTAASSLLARCRS
jgi:hypothetical protein